MNTRHGSILLRWMLCAILLAAVSCSTGSAIRGTVIDPFGKGVDAVAVSIDKTAFKATTDNGGRYSIDYAPGVVTVRFSKEGYATMLLEATINQKVDFPAATITMYPIPPSPGFYHVASTGLVPLASAPISRSEQLLARFSVEVPTTAPQVPAGKVAFIDRIDQDPAFTRLARVRGDGTLYEVTYHVMFPEEKYAAFLQDTLSKVGEEKLDVRTVTLEPGTYAWVQLDQGAVLSRGLAKACYPFVVRK